MQLVGVFVGHIDTWIAVCGCTCGMFTGNNDRMALYAQMLRSVALLGQSFLP